MAVASPGGGFPGGGVRRAFGGAGAGGFPGRGAFPGWRGLCFRGRGDGTGTGTGGFPGGGVRRRRGLPPAFGGGTGGSFAGGAGGGGFFNSSTSNPALTRLQADASRYAWVAATVNSNTAAGYQLASGDPVMAIGGFNGTDPAHPGAVRAGRRLGQDPLLHRQRRGRGRRLRGVRWWWQRRRRAADHVVGRVTLQLPGRGRVTIYDLSSGASG